MRSELCIQGCVPLFAHNIVCHSLEAKAHGWSSAGGERLQASNQEFYLQTFHAMVYLKNYPLFSLLSPPPPRNNLNVTNALPHPLPPRLFKRISSGRKTCKASSLLMCNMLLTPRRRRSFVKC